MTDVSDPEVPERARRRRYSAAYKQRILAEYESLDRAGKGALLRWEGLHTSLISAWRDQRDQGAREALGKPAGRAPAGPERRTPGCAEVLTAAYGAHPERFVRKHPEPPTLPGTVWINKPDPTNSMNS